MIGHLSAALLLAEGKEKDFTRTTRKKMKKTPDWRLLCEETTKKSWKVKYKNTPFLSLT